MPLWRQRRWPRPSRLRNRRLRPVTLTAPGEVRIYDAMDNPPAIEKGAGRVTLCTDRPEDAKAALDL